MTGYGLNLSSICVICTDTHCRSCPVDTLICTECLDGYGKMSGDCVPCNSACQTCLFTDATSCTSCNPIGFFSIVSYPFCTACLSYCGICTTPTSCRECVLGYYL